MAEPAPYGGFMTRTIDAENEQKEIIEKLLIEIDYDGQKQTVRPEALHLRGVDNLSTDDIKAFVDYYLNWEDLGDGQFKEKEEPAWFRVQWIDDSNVNVVFKTHKDSLLALNALCQIEEQQAEDIFSPEHLEYILKEREAKLYSDTLPFNKYHQSLKKQKEEQDLFADKTKEQEKSQEEETEMDEDSSAVVIYIRQSFQSDQKTKNASAYSRYYLLHGEPDRRERHRNERYIPRKERGRLSDRPQSNGDDEEDLFASKLRSRSRRDDEPDLFDSRMRERSPSRR